MSGPMLASSASIAGKLPFQPAVFPRGRFPGERQGSAGASHEGDPEVLMNVETQAAAREARTLVVAD